MRRECIINWVAACGQGVLPVLTSRLKIDQFINITETENKTGRINQSSSGKVDTRGEEGNNRERNKRNEQGT